ncbi:HAD family hydrolase [Ideonella sp.]|uniref:HAD family hydrolase n=1 Tax=Ideonella sp. TaxID=1929293 RepID=UPI0035B29FB7
MSGNAAPEADTAVVFDFGRVLFDWQPERLLAQVLPHRVVDEASAAHWVAQVFQGYTGDWGDFDRGVVEVPALVQRIAARTGLAPDEVQAVVDAVPEALQPLPGTVQLLLDLKAAGRPLYFLSNMPAPYAEHLERTHGFLACFDGGVFSSRAQRNKPDPALYAHAEQCFGRAPHALYFVDDHAPNVAAAQARGWRGHVFTGHQPLAEALRSIGVL